MVWKKTKLLEYLGNKEYLLNDRIYLLRVENEEKTHYIYIKHIEKLLNENTHVSGVNKKCVHIARR